ncbi:hypothetical protein E5Q_02047, partial [Mixia osmundae IAM 14324]
TPATASTRRTAATPLRSGLPARAPSTIARSTAPSSEASTRPPSAASIRSSTEAPARSAIAPRPTARVPAPISTRKPAVASALASARAAGRLGAPSTPTARDPIRPPETPSAERTPAAPPSPLPPPDVHPRAQGDAEEDTLAQRQAESAEIARAPSTDPFSIALPAVALKSEQTVPLRLFEEVQAKMRVLEARRADDRDKLRDLESMQEEFALSEQQKLKLQSRVTALQDELKKAHSDAKAAKMERDDYEKQYTDLADQVEMTTLDKEVAEEKVEVAEGAAEALKERVADLETQLKTYTEEKSLGTDTDGELSLDARQLQKQNDRLKEALSKMRDVFAESDAEHRRKQNEMEKELDLNAELQTAYDSTAARLEETEALVEDLKQQLDDAVGAEDLLEDLTHRNLALSEKLEEMRATVEDLEALRDLNEELEETHSDNEKQLQEVIAYKDTQLSDLRQRNEGLDEALLDHEQTIRQFRELVGSLQLDLEQLRTQHHSQRSETEALSSQTKAMQSLNLKLQSNVSRAQVKQIDLELRQMEAMQARSMLEIYRPYLPTSFFDVDGAAAEALQFFRRLESKTSILATVLSQKHRISDALVEIIPDTLVIACAARSRLVVFTQLCKCLAVNMTRCSSTTFVDMAKAYKEVHNVEAIVDGFVEQSRRDDLHEADCFQSLGGCVASVAHLQEKSFGRAGFDATEQQIGRLNAADANLDLLIAGLGFTKQAIALQSTATDPTVLEQLTQSTFTPLQDLINAARKTKVALRKVHSLLGDLEAKSKVYKGGSTAAGQIDILSQIWAGLAHQLADQVIQKRQAQLAGDNVQIDANALLSSLSAGSENTALPKTLSNWAASSALLGTGLDALCVELAQPALLEKVTYEPPWILRAEELRRLAATKHEAHDKLVLLTEDVKRLNLEITHRDRTLDETHHKTELLEQRLGKAKDQADKIMQLEADIEKARRQEKTTTDSLGALHAELANLAQENDKLKKSVSTPTPADAVKQDELGAYQGSLETSQLLHKIESLRVAVRHLRSENGVLRSQSLMSDLRELPRYRPAARPDPVRREIQSEAKLLLRQAALLSSSSEVVDLSIAPSDKGWRSQSTEPREQLARSRYATEQLRNRIRDLADRAADAGLRSVPLLT